jgi:hypothetical protein
MKRASPGKALLRERARYAVQPKRGRCVHGRSIRPPEEGRSDFARSRAICLHRSRFRDAAAAHTRSNN